MDTIDIIGLLAKLEVLNLKFENAGDKYVDNSNTIKEAINAIRLGIDEKTYYFRLSERFRFDLDIEKMKHKKQRQINRQLQNLDL